MWDPALRAAGLDHRRPYDMRHTFATFAIAAGVSMYYLARFMGISAQMIDRTYGHPFVDAEEQVRAMLDPFDGRALAQIKRFRAGNDLSKSPPTLYLCEKRTTGLEPATLGLGSQCSTS